MGSSSSAHQWRSVERLADATGDERARDCLALRISAGCDGGEFGSAGVEQDADPAVAEAGEPEGDPLDPFRGAPQAIAALRLFGVLTDRNQIDGVALEASKAMSCPLQPFGSSLTGDAVQGPVGEAHAVELDHA